jgi:hypothetical protein
MVGLAPAACMEVLLELPEEREIGNEAVAKVGILA